MTETKNVFMRAVYNENRILLSNAVCGGIFPFQREVVTLSYTHVDGSVVKKFILDYHHKHIGENSKGMEGQDLQDHLETLQKKHKSFAKIHKLQSFL